MAKKLARVDDAFAVVRHITEMSTTAFYEDVRAELRKNMPTPPSPTTRPTSTAPSTKPTTACRSSRSRTEELLQKAVNTPIDENDTDLQATESLASVHPPGLTTYDRIEHVNEGPPLAPTFARPGADARAQGALLVAAKAPPAVPAAIGVRGAAAPGQGACATPSRRMPPGPALGPPGPWASGLVPHDRPQQVAAKAPPAAPATHGVWGAAAPGQGIFATPCSTTEHVSPTLREAPPIHLEPGATDLNHEEEGLHSGEDSWHLPMPDGTMGRDVEIVQCAIDAIMDYCLTEDECMAVEMSLYRLRHAPVVIATGTLELKRADGKWRQIHVRQGEPLEEVIDYLEADLIAAKEHDEKKGETNTRKSDHRWGAYDALQFWLRCTMP